MRYSTRKLVALTAALALAACGGDSSTNPMDGGGGGTGGGGGGGTEPQPAAVVTVSGGGQQGRTLLALDNPLIVRVTDDAGTAVSGVTVSWSVTGGGSLSTTSTTTDTQGRASTTFTAGPALGTSTVQAAVSGVADPAEFTIETSIMVVRMSGTAFVAPDGSDDVTVPVGTTVEWRNFDQVQHTARSSDVPAGGQQISSGLMANGDTYPFTPMVEGTWTYFCEVHPGIMVGATITATAP
ncbi:MAG: Ig-like domain-containing protein [Gemmatimonadales bacterium]|jgi:plastocyanin